MRLLLAVVFASADLDAECDAEGTCLLQLRGKSDAAPVLVDARRAELHDDAEDREDDAEDAEDEDDAEDAADREEDADAEDEDEADADGAEDLALLEQVQTTVPLWSAIKPAAAGGEGVYCSQASTEKEPDAAHRKAPGAQGYTFNQCAARARYFAELRKPVRIVPSKQSTGFVYCATDPDGGETSVCAFGVAAGCWKGPDAGFPATQKHATCSVYPIPSSCEKDECAPGACHNLKTGACTEIAADACHAEGNEVCQSDLKALEAQMFEVMGTWVLPKKAPKKKAKKGKKGKKRR